jgi:crotonobetainyl-CoA:carnitine CoA-transferase CaiB-like acyl-CoA transferase
VKCSLEKAGIAGLVNQASNYLMTGNVPQRLGSKHPNIAPYGEVFHTKDNKQVVLAVGSDKQFQQLVLILNLQELASDERFENNISRVKNREELGHILQEKLRTLYADEFINSCIAHDVPAGRIKDLQEVFSSAPANNMVLDEIYDGEKTLRVQSVAFEIY